MKSKVSPTSRTLAFLRKHGYIAGVVERRNWYAGPPNMRCHACKKNRIGKTQDLFNCIDIIAVHPSEVGTLYVQVTSMSNRASRVEKILSSPEVRTLLKAGNRVVVHGWSKRGAAGARKLWTLDAVPVTLPMLPESTDTVECLDPVLA